MIHRCPECELMHDNAPGEGPRDSDEVTIARINAERDIAVARAAVADSREYNEARVAEAELEAEAVVAVAEVQAEAIAAVVAEGEADVEQTDAGDVVPVIVEAADEPPAAEPPPVAEPSSAGSAPKKSLWPYA